MPEDFTNPLGEGLEQVERLQRFVEELRWAARGSEEVQRHFSEIDSILDRVVERVGALGDAIVRSGGVIDSRMKTQLEEVSRLLSGVSSALSADVGERGMATAFTIMRSSLKEVLENIRQFPEMSRHSEKLYQLITSIGDSFERLWKAPLKDTSRLLGDIGATLTDIRETAEASGRSSEELISAISGAQSGLSGFGNALKESEGSAQGIVSGMKTAKDVMEALKGPGSWGRMSGFLEGTASAGGVIAAAGEIGAVLFVLNEVVDAIDRMVGTMHAQQRLWAVPGTSFMTPGAYGSEFGGIVQSVFIAEEMGARIQAYSRHLAISNKEFENLIGSMKSTGMMFEMVSRNMALYGDTYGTMLAGTVDQAKTAAKDIMDMTGQIVQFGRAMGLAPESVIRFTTAISRLTGERVIESAMYEIVELSGSAMRARMDLESFMNIVLQTADQLKSYGVSLDTIRMTAEHFGDALRVGVVSIQDMASVVKGMREAPMETMAQRMMMMATLPGVPGGDLARRLLEQGPGGVATFQAMMGGSVQLELLRRTQPEVFRSMMGAVGARTPQEFFSMADLLAAGAPMIPSALAAGLGVQGTEAAFVMQMQMGRMGIRGGVGTQYATLAGAEEMMRRGTEARILTEEVTKTLEEQTAEMKTVREIMERGEMPPGIKNTLFEWYERGKAEFFGFLSGGAVRVQVTNPVMQAGAPETTPSVPGRRPAWAGQRPQ